MNHLIFHTGFVIDMILMAVVVPLVILVYKDIKDNGFF